MSKVRVYEVARELGLENSEIKKRAEALGIVVSNHMSTLQDAEVEQLKKSIEKERAVDREETKIRPTVTRRRAKSRRGRASQVSAVDAEVAPEPVPVVAEVIEARKPEPVAVEEPPVKAVAEEPVVEAIEEPAVGVVEKPSVEEPVVEAAAVEGATEEHTVEAVEEPAAEESVEEVSEPNDTEAPAPAEIASAGEASGGVVLPPPSPEAEAQAALPEPALPEPEERPQPVRIPRQTMSTKVAPAAEDSQPQERSSDPPTPEDRFSHAPLPPGVTKRGNTAAPSAGARLSESERQRIVAEHAARRPRRREVRGRSSMARPPARTRRRDPRKKPKQTEITVPSAHKRRVRIQEQIGLQDLAQEMSLKATDLLMKLMQMGVAGVHINSTLDADTAFIIADEFGYEVENVARSQEEIVGDARGEFENREEDQETRAPIVTIMGHVDHGKTSLLDKIRAADVASGEAGGITQHISAFRVDTSGGPVVFLDTPGHEAFTAMRARGAQATDVVILVTAADDGVMPQTREAVNHSQAAGVPIIVAVNKMDTSGANPEKVKNELSALGLTPEDWGGETIFIPTSAKTGDGIDSLLNSVLLTSEILELNSNPKIPAEGVVLEARIDRGRGVVANVLVRDGSLSVGDFVVAGASWGRVKAMTNDRGQKVKTAAPSTPVELIGLDSIPSAGELIYKVTDQKKAQEVAEAAAEEARGATITTTRGLDQLQQFLKSGEQEELQVVIKGDVHGSVEALKKSLEELTTDKVRVKIIHSGVGGITENDVMLASASEGIILGFNVRPQGKASATASKSGVEIRTYSVIYEAIDDVKAAMEGLLAPSLVESDLGEAEVRETFGIPKIGTIAGCMVTTGKILRNGNARIIRDGVVLWDGKMGSLRRFKDTVPEVKAGFECGIGLEGFNDIEIGDIIECYEVQEVAAKL